MTFSLLITIPPLLLLQDAMGVCVQTGLALAPHSVSQVQLMVKSLTLCGSALGGLPNTQKVVDFCAQHNIIPRVRTIRHTDLDQVFQQLSQKNDSICRSYHWVYW